MRVLFTTLMFMFHLHIIKQEKDLNLIETICRNTPNYQLCVSIFKADPRSVNADVEGLSLIMVDAVKAKAEETRSTIDKLKGSQPYVGAALNDCAYRYNAILKADVPEAVEALIKGVPKFAESGMADSVVEADVCEKNFKPGMSPLSELNKAVRDLSDVARAIIRNLL